jgi:SSS family solute:Na+ symporter
MFFQAGGLSGFHAQLDAEAPYMMSALGGIPVPQAIVLVVLCINLYKDPAFYQRFAAAKTPQTGKRALLTCFSIFMSFDLVMMMTGIIVGMKFHPDAILAGEVQPEVEYIRLVLESLPVGLRGFFIVGLTGAIISTLDSYYLVGGEIISNDIIYMLRGDKRLPDKTAILITRVSAVIFGIIGLATAFRFARVYDAFLFLASISMTLLFVPMIAALMYDGKKTNVAGLASMIVGAVSWIWFTVKPIVVDTVTGPYTIDAVLIGLPLSFIAFLIGNRFGTDLTAKAKAEALEKGIPLADLGLDTVELTEEYKESIKVEWIGADGALIRLYIVLACFYGYGMLHNVDWIVGYAAPIIAMGIVIFVFVKYLTEVFAVVRAHKEKDVA